ncbi:hypothetical protein [uncultured Ruminobacter sp.]|jgi:hypothetical protein|uniref:hypothetical protein n=1 Tax=Ruminobacter sp. TaxID=2774296 RepID=UPI0025EE44E6|nr:hypothetical protein [uncultured Ruminobacter sp.]
MEAIKYMTGLLTFYIKGEIATEQNFLKIRFPNTLLALIPLGSRKYNVPVAQISSVASNFKFDIKSFFIGLIFALISFSCFSAGGNGILAGLIILALGLCLLINSFITELKVDTTSGTYYYIPFIIFEKAKASQAEQMISSIIANRLNDTNNRQVSEASTNAIVDAIKSK